MAYVWSLPGGSLPATGPEWLPISAEELPPAVVAFALREAAARRLVADCGFHHLRGRVDAPARLFRRDRNLAAVAGLQPDPSTGVFPLLALQGIVLGDEAAPVACGLVVDVETTCRLDVSLGDLAAAGIGLAGLPLRWRHLPGCTCSPRLRGWAGVCGGGDPSGQVAVRRFGTSSAPAACLAATATRTLLEDYLSRLHHSELVQIHAELDRALEDQKDLRRTWNAVIHAASLLRGLKVLGGIAVRLDGPLEVGAEASGPGWPRRLRPAARPQLNFHYGAPELAQQAGSGLLRFGPYDQDVLHRVVRLDAAILAPRSLQGAAERLRRALTAGIAAFAGMQRPFRLTAVTAEVHLLDDPGPAAYRRAAARLLDSVRQPNFVFLIIRPQDRYAAPGEDPYRLAKALLVARRVPSQAITSATLEGPDGSVRWAISNLALAVYAKLGNVPFVLHDPSPTRELILGVGRADTEDPATGESQQMFGSAVVFRQDGDFLYGGSTAVVSDRYSYRDGLRDMIRGALTTYEQEQGVTLDRFTVHVFKRTGRQEIAAVAEALAGRAIEVALLHVNRDTPLQFLKVSAEGAIGAAPAGTVVALGDRDRLLATGDSRPVRLVLDEASTHRDLNRLVDQAYGLCAMSWRGYGRARTPVTIAYGHLLAAKVAALRAYGLDGVGLGRQPWFL
jgi:hypothetical protein